MSVEYVYTVSFGLALDDALLAAFLKDTGSTLDNGDTLAQGGLFRLSEAGADAWPDLSFEQCHDQWSGRAHSRILVTTASSGLSLDLTRSPQNFPVALTHQGSAEELTALEDFRQRYCPQVEACFIVGGSIF